MGVPHDLDVLKKKKNTGHMHYPPSNFIYSLALSLSRMKPKVGGKTQQSRVLLREFLVAAASG